MREMDLILGRFCDAELGSLTDDEMTELERLMNVPDQELFGWIIDPSCTPLSHRTALLARIRAFPAHKASTGA